MVGEGQVASPSIIGGQGRREGAVEGRDGLMRTGEGGRASGDWPGKTGQASLARALYDAPEEVLFCSLITRVWYRADVSDRRCNSYDETSVVITVSGAIRYDCLGFIRPYVTQCVCPFSSAPGGRLSS